MKNALVEGIVAEMESLVQWETPEHEKEVKEWLKTKLLSTFEHGVEEGRKQAVEYIKKNAEYIENSYEDRDGNYYIVDTEVLLQAHNKQ